MRELAVSAASSSLASRARGAAAWILTALGPACLVVLVFRYFVPSPAEAEGTWAAVLADLAAAHPIGVSVTLLLGFAALVRYWVAAAFEKPTDAPSSSVRRRRSASWVAVGVGIFAALAIRATVGVYRVESTSMLPTLEPLDVLAGMRTGAIPFLPKASAALPARGELVVFRKPSGVDGPPLLVKRVVGLPGDRISMRGSLPVINGEVVRSCEAGPYLFPLSDGGGVLGRVFVEFLGERPHLALYSLASEPWSGSYEVKPGEVFVLGDNRDNSSDSRAWNHGKGAGLAVDTIEVRVRRWLFGTRRDDRVDVDHLLKPLELDLRLSGLDSSYLRDHIRECLEHPPADAIKVASHGS
jgi:signal peptidase I